jgi:ParB-like nuclease domain
MAKNNHQVSPIETLAIGSNVKINNAKSGENELPWQIEMTPVDSLRPAKRNARTHSKRQIREISDSIRRYGVMCPIIADEKKQIVAGHARVEASKNLGLKHLPVIQVSHLSEAELRAYTLADNALAAKSGWDRRSLAVELKELQIALPEIDLDISATGFDPGEVDTILLDFADNEPSPADELPGPEDQTVAQKGDLFKLGDHRLFVGDARDEQAFIRLMHGRRAEMTFLGPPYNVKIHGHTGGRGRVKTSRICVCFRRNDPSTVRAIS